MSDVPVLKFRPPSPDEPGYLRRVRSALEHQKVLAAEPSPESIDALVEFILPYIYDPEDRDQARNALWDASEAQFNQLLTVITGGDENPTEE